jgi:hypothetical protein
MKKKPKGKQNWFKTQFKKHPYLYTFVIGWPILFYIIGEFIDPIVSYRFDYVLLIILFSFPIIIFFLWFRKNKSKIKPFYKRNKKIFKPIFYTVGGIISFAIISLIITVITLGGFANFTERAKFEYLVWNDQHDLCSQPGIAYTGYGEYSKFFWKANFQFIDYFKYKPYTVVKNVVNLKDDFLYNFNHCKATRYLLRAAHQDHKVAKDILATYPGDFASFYGFDDKYLFERYRNSLDEKKLYNAALVNAFANKLDKGDYVNDLEKRRKLHKEAAEEGYLLGMQDYLYTFTEEEKINKSECPFILKYSNHLSEQNSLMESINSAYALIGKTSMETTRTIYECSDKKTDFAKAILLLKNFYNKFERTINTSNFITTYPAIIYFNGWGNVEKDQKLAYELFSINNENNYGSQISKAYIAFVKLNEQNSENNEEGTKLLKEIFNSEVSEYGDPTTYIYCENIKYDFKIPYVKKETDQEEQARKTEYLKPLKSCLNKASNDEKIEFVKSYIKSWIENWFKNPELVKTLNLYG